MLPSLPGDARVGDAWSGARGEPPPPPRPAQRNPAIAGCAGEVVWAAPAFLQRVRVLK